MTALETIDIHALTGVTGGATKAQQGLQMFGEGLADAEKAGSAAFIAEKKRDEAARYQRIGDRAAAFAQWVTAPYVKWRGTVHGNQAGNAAFHKELGF